MMVSVFLSYADKDKEVANTLHDKLSEQNIDVFISSKDLIISDIWLNELKAQIEKCELFMVLLSNNFRSAEYTDHEVGYAIANNKRIYTVRIDDLEPYGFMRQYHAKIISPEIKNSEINELSHGLIRYVNDGVLALDEQIKTLKTSTSYREANANAKFLSDCSYFTNEQINNIAKIYQENREVRDAWTSGPICRQIIVSNKDKVDTDIKNAIIPKD